MIVSTITGDTSVVIRPRGDIDDHTLPTLTAAFEALPSATTHVTWDLHDIHFMDVAGLHLLIDQRRACQETGRTLTVTGLPGQTQRLLRLAEELFPAGAWHDFVTEPAA
ncbi:STAS domain-containing protein [Streptomyces sp. NPDC005386]|uniref:STAS domain-containing protein n=1 Tax=Streptomyces sp. NPDC005386 TaxID=3154562 RepID=UPI0033A0D623